MAISDSAKAKIDKMNRASQDVSLGTIVQGLQNRQIVASGSHLVYAADTNASKIVIPTGLGTIVGFNVQSYFSGSTIMPGLYVSPASGSLTIMATSGCSTLEANQKIYWIAW